MKSPYMFIHFGGVVMTSRIFPEVLEGGLVFSSSVPMFDWYAAAGQRGQSTSADECMVE